MRFCVIKVGDFCYTAFSPSTCEAVADALKRFPHARRVSVRSKLHWALPSFSGTSNDAVCLAGRHANEEKNVYTLLPFTSSAAARAAWGAWGAWGQELTYGEQSWH